ncbi:MAG: hypothetical protein L3J54_00415 [Draconibacterium sp.]|nr:hypothetical protein [Draconibacterium sp.]
MVLLLCSGMNRDKKNIISFLLAAVLLMPVVVQFADGQFHHHHHKHTHSITGVLQLEDYNEDCPIAAFEYFLFQSDELKYEPEKHLVADRLTIPQPQNSLTNYFDYSFLLRAPPVM